MSKKRINMGTGKRIVFMLFMTMPFMAGARNVDTLLAKTLAESVLSAKGVKPELHDITSSAWEGSLLLYAGEKGFVLMPADDAVRPILAYSPDAAFPTDSIPPQVQVFVQQFIDIVENARRHKLPRHPEWDRPVSGATTHTKDGNGVAPLVTCHWDQGRHYNTLCPLGSTGVHHPTGCVATAMAQIMYYWRWPDTGWGEHSYVWRNAYNQPIATLSESFDTVHYLWNLMTDEYDSLSTDAETYAVSRLMYDCGVAVEMNYASSGSGAQLWIQHNPSSPSAGQALRTYFRYNPMLHCVSRDSYSDSEWVDIMQAELDASRPVLYGATSLTMGAHAIVVDGYDEARRLHFNFGWSGSYNGFYAVDSICYYNDYGNPVSWQYLNHAVIGIRPNTEDCGPYVTISLSSDDTLAGSCSGGGQYTYADSASLKAFAAEGYRFDGWTSGSSSNPHYIPATMNMSDTARIRSIDSDTLFYHTLEVSFPYYHWPWSESGATTRWGIRIPSRSLHGNRRLQAVQFYKGYPVDDTVRLQVYNGNHPDDGEPTYAHTYAIPGASGWVNLAVDKSVTIDTASDLWIVFEVDSGKFNLSNYYCSTYGGNSDGCWFYNSTGWHTLDSIGIWSTWMIRAVTDSIDPGEVRITLVEDGNAFVAYPNPFRQSVKIKVESGELKVENGVATAWLTDLTGRREEVRLTPDGPGQYSLDLTSRPQATYLLTLTTADGKQHTVRLLKQSDIFDK